MKNKPNTPEINLVQNYGPIALRDVASAMVSGRKTVGTRNDTLHREIPAGASPKDSLLARRLANPD